jgi:Domain of unknown function (DUF5655)/Domain of unknown function (DUF4287)
MSMQAYLDTIEARTGKTPEDFVVLAGDKGLLEPGVKARQVIAWLREDFGLGHGHAMAIVATLKKHTDPPVAAEDKVAAHFAGKKSSWRPAYDELLAAVTGFGPDVDVDPGRSYLSLRRSAKKFAIVQVTSGRLDLGLKLKNPPETERLELSGNWNAMVTHRLRINRLQEIDEQVIAWLRLAYDELDRDARSAA